MLMPLNKKIISVSIFLLVSTVALSGCIIQDLLFGASFDLTDYNITDSQGFPALNLLFSASGKVILKTYDKGNHQVDTNYFYSDGDTTLNIGSYMENIEPGDYYLEVYNKNNDEIYDKKFSLKGPSLSILSCDQKWWKNDDLYYLIGLGLTLKNTGDSPSYPYSLKLSTTSENVTGNILPDAVLPGETKTVYCYLYHKGTFQEDDFTIQIFDKDENIISSGSFSFEVSKNIYNRYYSISALDNTLVAPYADFLYDYYSNLDRIYLDDYSVFVFDKYDDAYLDFLLDLIISTVDFGDFRFNLKTDKQKVEYITSFVQGLDYKKDSNVDDSYEYPRYPVETLFNGRGGGDCEDKAIFTASLLNSYGYKTALLRLPDHMAVGVKLAEDAVKGDYYIDDYDFLETTTPGFECGKVSEEEYENPSNLTVYPIKSRPLLLHEWQNDLITTYKKTEDGDIVKVVSYTTNLGNETAENIVVEGLFYVEGEETEYNHEEVFISKLEPGDKKKTILTVEIPKSTITKFKTRVYLNGLIVDSERSEGYFP